MARTPDDVLVTEAESVCRLLTKGEKSIVEGCRKTLSEGRPLSSKQHSALSVVVVRAEMLDTSGSHTQKTPRHKARPRSEEDKVRERALKSQLKIVGWCIALSKSHSRPTGFLESLRDRLLDDRSLREFQIEKLEKIRTELRKLEGIEGEARPVPRTPHARVRFQGKNDGSQ